MTANSDSNTSVASTPYPNLDPYFDFNNQSVEIDPINHVRVATTRVGKPLVESRSEDLRTLADVLVKGMKQSGNGDCVGVRKNGKGPYVFISYSEVIERVKLVGSGLLSKGIQPVNSTNIGIYAKNQPEWVVAEHTCYNYSMTIISLFDTYGEASIKFILDQAQISAVFVDNFKRIQNVVKVSNELPNLRLIVHFDELTSDQYKQLVLPKHLELISLNDLIKIGRSNFKEPVLPKPSDLCTICYTSGTTGQPKGAMISHANVIAVEAALYYRRHRPHLNVPGADTYNPTPVHYSYLPLAHMFERYSTLAVLIRGGKIGYMSTDLKGLAEDCSFLKPTNMPLVPRLLNRIYDMNKNDIGNDKEKLELLKEGIDAKENDRLRGVIQRNMIYDKLVFNKTRNMFGGELIRSSTGSAPITDDVLKFARSALACPIPECYGQTEATLDITASHILDPQIGHCGPPIDSMMVKLVDIPEMGYFAKNNKGEVCCKGPSIIRGYYKSPEKTAEVIDKDGWLHTGDVGMWLPNGCLKIIDRKKHVFKLAQGEYIAPEKIESIYMRSLFVAQVFVDGDSLKDAVIAIVVPNEEYILNYAKENNIEGNFKELCHNNLIRRAIKADFDSIGARSNLMYYEKIKNIHLHDELFSPENGFVTPTMKLKRLELRQYFKNVIQNLYREAENTTSKL